MSGFLILIGLAVLAVPVAVVYLVVAMSGAKSRLKALEHQIEAMASELLGRAGGAVQDASDPSVQPERPAQAAGPTETARDAKVFEPVAQDVTASSTAWPDEKSAERAQPTKTEFAPPEPPPAPRAVVFRAERMAAAAAWLKENWFLAVAAISLALAGIFLVQYGIENGLLTPFWRVAGAVALGLALVGAGEVIRRRFGDDDGETAAATAFLPSTFSGAGLVALFAAVLSAHYLYGTIGAGASFFWLVGVAAISVALGWFYGPYLTLVRRCCTNTGSSGNRVLHL